MNAPLTEERVQALRRLLQEQKRELQTRMRHNDHYQLSATLRESLDELSTYDNHPGDQGTETFERSKDLALLERDAFRLLRIDEALERIKTGEYGRCKECGAFIPLERMEAMPTADHCVEHEPRQDISRRRPVEEIRMWPSWGHTEGDREDFVGFDGEDAWQIVASYGTSNSPAMSENRQVEEYDLVHVEAGEREGYVEALESFLATDITGRRVSVVRNREYYKYLDNNEGDHMLEPDEVEYDG